MYLLLKQKLKWNVCFFNVSESNTNTYIGIRQNQESTYNNSIRVSITPKNNKLTTIDKNDIRNALCVYLLLKQKLKLNVWSFNNAFESNTNTYIVIRQNQEYKFNNSIRDLITLKYNKLMTTDNNGIRNA